MSTQTAAPNEAPKADPILRLVLQDADGKSVMSPIQIKIPRELSKRVATLHLTEMLGKLLKAQVGDMLKGLGFK
jgi:hypothetical protein